MVGPPLGWIHGISTAVTVLLDGKLVGEAQGADVGTDGVARFDRSGMLRLVGGRSRRPGVRMHLWPSEKQNRPRAGGRLNSHPAQFATKLRRMAVHVIIFSLLSSWLARWAYGWAQDPLFCHRDAITDNLNWPTTKFSNSAPAGTNHRF